MGTRPTSAKNKSGLFPRFHVTNTTGGPPTRREHLSFARFRFLLGRSHITTFAELFSWALWSKSVLENGVLGPQKGQISRTLREFETARPARATLALSKT